MGQKISSKTFKSLNKEGICTTINKSSLGRLYQHLKQGDSMVFVSANRSELSEQENDKNYKELQGIVKRARFGYNKIIDGYLEKNDDGSEVEVQEKSIVFFGPKEREQELKDLAISLGKKYNQDSVMYVYPGGLVVYIGTRSDSSVGGLGKEMPLGDAIDTHNIEKFYTRIGKRKFVFKSISEEVGLHYGSMAGRVLSDLWRKYVDKYGPNALEQWDKDLIDNNTSTPKL